MFYPFKKVSGECRVQPHLALTTHFKNSEWR